MTPTSPTSRRRDWLVLCGALSLLALTLAATSCGNGDLVFPGNIPSTSTAGPTSTAVPTSS